MGHSGGQSVFSWGECPSDPTAVHTPNFTVGGNLKTERRGVGLMTVTHVPGKALGGSGGTMTKTISMSDEDRNTVTLTDRILHAYRRLPRILKIEAPFNEMH